MQWIIIDTSALIASFIVTEQNHAAARDFLRHNRTARWIILSTVFDETVTWIRSRIAIQVSITIGQILREEHRYVHLSGADDAATWQAFRQYDDKHWSYTDCSILVMSGRLGVPHVFSFDGHIRQMAGLGVICIPQ